MGGRRLFAIGNEHSNPNRAVEKVVNAAVEGALRDAERLLVTRPGAISLAELARGFNAHRGDVGGQHEPVAEGEGVKRRCE